MATVSLFFIAFLKPFNVQLFNISVGTCELSPPPGSRSCADELRALLHSILFLNIVVGQAIEVGTLCAKGIKNRAVARLKRSAVEVSHELGEVNATELVSKAQSAATELVNLTPSLTSSRASATTTGGGAATTATRTDTGTGSASGSATPAAFSSSCRILPPLKSAAEKQYVMRLLAELERPPLRSVEQGLGNTYYEYNEMVLQYGYVVLFAVAAPIAPLLALANNLIEIRTDFMKMIVLARVSARASIRRQPH